MVFFSEKVAEIQALLLDTYWINTMHVCTYMNVFHKVIPIIVTKLNNSFIFEKKNLKK